MNIEEELTTRLKQAMRTKNTSELDVLRMVKTAAQAKKTAPGFSGETDDAFWRDVIARYVKQQQKALVAFREAGDQGQENVAKLEFEIAYLTPFLPQQMDEQEVRERVRQVIAETGAAGPKMIGKVIGTIVKAHRDEVDPLMVKRIAAEELGN
ncbi:MAG: GatB/YqeY domain-containing protein [Myxococcota bacterium]|nr:GatB/YqeY domain-containing protein [Myxococcota bacterium]